MSVVAVASGLPATVEATTGFRVWRPAGAAAHVDFPIRDSVLSARHTVARSARSTTSGCGC
eukprot:6454598-Prymnesium_polylepis.1